MLRVGRPNEGSVLFCSLEHLDAFGARLAPILEEVEIDTDEFEVLAIQKIIGRGSNG